MISNSDGRIRPCDQVCAEALLASRSTLKFESKHRAGRMRGSSFATRASEARRWTCDAAVHRKEPRLLAEAQYAAWAFLNARVRHVHLHAVTLRGSRDRDPLSSPGRAGAHRD